MFDRVPSERAPEESAAQPAVTRQPPPRPAAFLALASAIGNQAATQLARSEAGAGGAGPGPGTAGAGTTAARDDPGADGGPGVPGFDAVGASDDERLAEIRTRLSDGRDVLEIWRAFADIPAMANAHPELWTPSAKRHPDLAHDEQVQARFKERVEQLALEGLATSRDAVGAEIEALGVDNERKPDHDKEHLDAVAKLQKQAGELKRALLAKERLLAVPVGWEDPPPAADPSQTASNGPQPVRFKPDRPPPRGDDTGDPGFRPYDQVLKEYRPIEAIIAQGMAHPALFALAEEGGGHLEDFSKMPKELGQVDIGHTLHGMLAKVEKATAALGGSLDHRDLKPIHEKVVAEAPFTNAYERSIAQQAVADRDSMKTWIALGLTIPAAVALLVPGGAGAFAAIVGVLGSAGQVGMSWADYQRMKTAREARTAPGQDLVTKEQYDDAAIALALDTAFLFLDGIAAIGKTMGAGKAGNVSKLAELPADQADAALGEAMAAMGAGPAIEAAGGIGTVRAAAGKTGAGVRADAFANGVVDALGAHLGELPEGADLLAEAQRFVAERAGVSAPRALHLIAPEYKDLNRLADLIVRSKGRQVAGWKELSIDARAALVHQEAIARMPHPPKLLLSTAMAQGTAHFDPETWTIVYSVKDFTSPAMTEGELVWLKSFAVHEAEHGVQYFESFQMQIQTAANRAAAIAQLKSRGLDAKAIDAAAAAPPLDAAGLNRAAPHHHEMLGTGAGFAAHVENAVKGAHTRFMAEKEQWQAAKDVVYALVGTNVHPDKLARAELEVIEAHKRMVYEYNTIRQYHALAIERGAFDAQIAFLKPVEAEIEATAKVMWALVGAGAFVAGGAIGGTTVFKVRERREKAPASPKPISR